MRLTWYVALGSAAGGVARFLLATALQQRTASTFPIGTLVVNVSGSLLFGFLLRWALATPTVSPEMRVLLTTGFCGGYTTFSTFSYESMALFDTGDWRRGLSYVVLSVALSLAGVVAGTMVAARTLARP